MTNTVLFGFDKKGVAKVLAISTDKGASPVRKEFMRLKRDGLPKGVERIQLWEGAAVRKFNSSTYEARLAAEKQAAEAEKAEIEALEEELESELEDAELEALEEEPA